MRQLIAPIHEMRKFARPEVSTFVTPAIPKFKVGPHAEGVDLIVPIDMTSVSQTCGRWFLSPVTPV